MKDHKCYSGYWFKYIFLKYKVGGNAKQIDWQGFLFFLLSRHAYSWKSCWERGLWYLSNHRRKEMFWKLAGGWQKQDDKALTDGLTWLCLCLRIKELVVLLLSQLASKAVHKYFKVNNQYICCANSGTEPFLEWYRWLQLQKGQTEKKVAINWSQGEEKDTFWAVFSVWSELFLFKPQAIIRGYNLNLVINHW